MRDNMLFMTSWIETLKTMDLSDVQLNEACRLIIEYGCYGEYQKSSDPVVNASVGFLYPQIDNMQASYDSKSEQGKKGGRKSTLDNKQIWEMAHSGMTAKAIAEKLGRAPTTISSSAGWKQRNNENYEN